MISDLCNILFPQEIIVLSTLNLPPYRLNIQEVFISELEGCFSFCVQTALFTHLQLDLYHPEIDSKTVYFSKSCQTSKDQRRTNVFETKHTPMIHPDDIGPHSEKLADTIYAVVSLVTLWTDLISAGVIR